MQKIFTFLRFSFIVCTITALIFSMAVPAQSADGLQVESAAICLNVVDREPVDSGNSFTVSVEKLFCFTKIVGAESPTEITHVWYYGDIERARISLTVGSNSWRTYSSKILQAHEIGTWRVEVLGPSGDILETVTFSIVQ